jgi:hypothetical protein
MRPFDAHEPIFQLLRPSTKFPAAFDEIGDDPHARMIPLCGMGMDPTVKLADHEPLRCAFWLLLQLFALEVTTFPRAQCGLA